MVYSQQLTSKSIKGCFVFPSKAYFGQIDSLTSIDRCNKTQFTSFSLLSYSSVQLISIKSVFVTKHVYFSTKNKNIKKVLSVHIHTRNIVCHNTSSIINTRIYGFGIAIPIIRSLKISSNLLSPIPILDQLQAHCEYITQYNTIILLYSLISLESPTQLPTVSIYLCPLVTLIQRNAKIIIAYLLSVVSSAIAIVNR